MLVDLYGVKYYCFFTRLELLKLIMQRIFVCNTYITNFVIKWMDSLNPRSEEK